MSSQKYNGYYFALEGIRGVAAILVAIRHTGSVFHPIRSPTSFLAVDVFFLLSGFVLAVNYHDKLANKTISAMDFFILRLIRIYPLYLIGSLIGFVALIANAGAIVPSYPLILAKALFFVPSLSQDGSLYPLNPPAWSLFAELLMGAIYGAWLSRASQRVIGIVVILSGCLLAYGILHNGSADIGYQYNLFYYSVIRVGFSFGVGMLLYINLRHIENMFPRIGNWGTLGVLIASALLLIVPIRHGHMLQPLYSLLAVFILFPILITIALRCQPTGRVRTCSVWLGKLSFPLYVFHVPLLSLIEFVFHRLSGVDIDRYAPWAGPPVLLFICLVAVLADVLLDEPVRRFLRRTWFHIKRTGYPA